MSRCSTSSPSAIASSCGVAGYLDLRTCTTVQRQFHPFWVDSIPTRTCHAVNGELVEANYSTRDGKGRNGKTTGGYKGKYIITLLELDGQVGDNAKYGVQVAR